MSWWRQLATDIDQRQYRRVSKKLDVLACCPSLTARALSPAQAEEAARLLKVLADPVRLRVLSLILSTDGDEACVCDLTDAFDLTQPTMSHHLKVLHDAGLVDREKRGVWVYYKARPEALAALAGMFVPT